jgi:hypothetical protein
MMETKLAEGGDQGHFLGTARVAGGGLMDDVSTVKPKTAMRESANLCRKSGEILWVRFTSIKPSERDSLPV